MLNSINFFKAIGEVFLIFFGVILAVIANHYYQQSKDCKTRKIFYKSIIKDLEVSLLDLDRDLEGHKKAQKVSIELWQFIEAGSLSKNYREIKWDYLFIDFQFYPSRGTYESIKSKGFDLFEDQDKQLEKLISLYELDFHRLVEFGKDKSLTRSIKKIMDPIQEKYFRIKKSDKLKEHISLESNYISITKTDSVQGIFNLKHYKLFPNNYKLVANSEEFKLSLFRAIEVRSKKIVYYEEIKARVYDLINELKKMYTL